jgi:phosphate-selective porin
VLFITPALVNASLRISTSARGICSSRTHSPARHGPIAATGYFDTIKPRTSVGDGGWGAWEVALRMSELDLSDDDIDGGRERDATLGVNWYMNRWIKLMGNLVKVMDVDGGPFDDAEPMIYEMRFQFLL